MFEPGPHPLVVAIAGPNGAGKSTFFARFVFPTKLQFVNADVLAAERGLGAYAAAHMAEKFRDDLIARRQSFVFETVFSDPVGAKVEFLHQTVEKGCRVVLCFIGLDSAEQSDGRVALRVTRGGHDVPTEKIMARYVRTLENLARALCVLPLVLVYDNSDLAQPFRFVAEYQKGTCVRGGENVPVWFDEARKLRRS